LGTVGTADRESRSRSWKAGLAFHNYSANEGSASYGDELDLSVQHTYASGTKIGVKYADYSADTHSADVTKLWIWLGLSF
jgi:hypothetical protein